MMNTLHNRDNKWNNIPEQTAYANGSLPGNHAAVCKLYKCDIRVIMTVTFNTEHSKHVIQHGPNEEHVLLFEYPKNGYIAIDIDAIRTQDQLPDDIISIDDWLVRVHEEALR